MPQPFRRAQVVATQPFREDDLSTMIATPGGTFVSQATIHHFLAKLLHALASNRVSPRRASSLAYIAGLVAQTQKAAKDEVANWSDEKHLCYSLAQLQGFKFPPGSKVFDPYEDDDDDDSESAENDSENASEPTSNPEPVSVS